MKKNQALPTAVVFILMIDISLAQTIPAIRWEHAYGGSGIESSRQVIKCSDGNLLNMFITTSSDGEVTGLHGSTDIWIVKTDLAGNIIWQKTYGGSGYDAGDEVVESDDGGFVILGSTDSDDGDVTGHHGEDDLWVFKIDAYGNLIWEKALGGSRTELTSHLLKLSSGGYVVLSISYSKDGDLINHYGSSSLPDIWVLKLDESGNMLWQTVLGGSKYDDTGDILETSDHFLLLEGVTSSTDGDVTDNHGGFDAWIVKLDDVGQIVWQKTFGGIKNDALLKLIEDEDGNFVATGFTHSSSVPGYHKYGDVWVLKFDHDGNMIWQMAYGGSRNEEARSVIQTSDGGYLVAANSNSKDGDVIGHHQSGSTITNDYWIIKIASDGTLQWQRSLGGTDEEFCLSAMQMSSGVYIVNGYAHSHDGDVIDNHGLYDIWVVELDASGEMVWERALGGSNDDSSLRMLRINSVHVLICGTTNSSNGDVSENHGQQDAWLVMLRTSENLKTENENAGEEISFEVFPNPVTSTATISFSLDEDSRVLIELFSIDGKRVSMIANQNFSAGAHRLEFSREVTTPGEENKYSQGFYLLHFTSGENRITRKVVFE